MNLAIKTWVRGTHSYLHDEMVVDENFARGTVGESYGNGS